MNLDTNSSIYNAFEQLTSSDKLVTSPDQVSKTILDIEEKLRSRMAFYAENSYEYFIGEDLEKYNLTSVYQIPINIILDPPSHEVSFFKEGFPHLNSYLLSPFFVKLKSICFQKYEKQLRLIHKERTIYGISIVNRDMLDTFIECVQKPNCLNTYLCFQKISVRPLCETKLNPDRYIGYKNLENFILGFKKYTETIFPDSYESKKILDSTPIINEGIKTGGELIERVLKHFDK